MSGGIVRLCTRMGIGMATCLIAVTIAHSEAEASYIKSSIGCNVDYYFSPFRRTNGDLKKRDYHEITGNAPQFGVELACFKHDAAWNAKRSLSFLYIYWQDKGGDGDYYTKIHLHEFSARVRVYLLRHLAVSPFLGCGMGFQTGTIKASTPQLSAIGEAEYRNAGGVITLLTGIEWQNRPKGGIIRLESGYRHMPSTSEWPRGVRMNTSCWFAGINLGLKM